MHSSPYKSLAEMVICGRLFNAVLGRTPTVGAKTRILYDIRGYAEKSGISNEATYGRKPCPSLYLGPLSDVIKLCILSNTSLPASF